MINANRISEEEWAEVQRLARQVIRVPANSGYRDELRMEDIADLLAEIGVIHNTPLAKRDWINFR